MLNSDLPYFTLVIGVTLTGDLAEGGRPILQGAYVAQREYNLSVKPGGRFLRLLIANAGSLQANATAVACQVVQSTQVDKTIVGVMGWDNSAELYNAISVLSHAHIPLLSATSSSDFLSKISPYFWRIVPSDASQAKYGADYAKGKLAAKKVALFEDLGDFYSESLANDFRKSFAGITFTEQYKRGQDKQLSRSSTRCA